MSRARYGLTFESSTPIERSQHLRADVALFVGYVAAKRSGPLGDPSSEAPLREWLRAQGFADRVASLAVAATATSRGGFSSVATLTQTPVPVESWSDFERLFAWDARRFEGGLVGATYLGASVRAFFSQGGRRAYVVRAGDPWTKASVLDAATLNKQLWGLVPGAAVRPVGEPIPTPLERATWRGITHLYGLDDVSFVLVPDLPDLFDATPTRAPQQIPATEEVFVTCSDTRAPSIREHLLSRVPPPACDDERLAGWARAVASAADLLRRQGREAMLLASIPLLRESSIALASVSAESPLPRLIPHLLGGCESAFLQLTAPWLITLGSSALPGGVEPPDGTVAGLLARNALARGTFRSAAGAVVPLVDGLVPTYDRAALLDAVDVGGGRGREPLSLLQRVSVIGHAPGRFELLSDVTTSVDEAWRSAGASRLVGAVRRAARSIGEGLSFEVSNESLWRRVRSTFEAMMRELWEAQALRGDTPEAAFEVRCDRSTMTQDDLDAGRVVVRLRMEAAVSIESISVSLALSEGGRVAVLSQGASS